MRIINQEYSLESVYQIWNNEWGDRHEVSIDPDSGSAVYIRYITDDGVKSDGLYIPVPAAKKIHIALSEVMDAAPDYPEKPIVIQATKHDDGEYFEVGEDSDGCENPEIRGYSDGKLRHRFNAPIICMRLIQKAIANVILDLERCASSDKNWSRQEVILQTIRELDNPTPARIFQELRRKNILESGDRPLLLRMLCDGVAVLNLEGRVYAPVR